MKKKRRMGDWALTMAGCVLILLAAWAIVAAMTVLMVRAWAKDPLPPVSDVQRQIAIEAVKLEDPK